MPEPISTLSLCYLAGHAALTVYARSGSAVSTEARVAQEAASAVVASAEQSQALFGDKSKAISELRSMADECSKDGWDGDGASAIDPLAVIVAERVVRALPDGIPLPECGPEPDGSISLDWIRSRNRLFSMSVGSGNRLAYAWLDGTDRGHGVARFDGNTIPPRVLAEIRAIMDHGHAFFRAA